MGLLINPYRFAVAAPPATPPPVTSGLLAWYRASSFTTLADGASIATSWQDESGNSNHATLNLSSSAAPKWRATQGSAGGAAVEFTGGSDGSGSFFQLPTGILTGATAAEAMTTVKATGVSSQGFWAFGQDASGNQTHFPFTDGNVYDAFGLASGQRQSFTPTMTVRNTWRRYNVWSAASDWTARLDETTQKASTTATPTFYSAPRIGRGRNGGATESSWAGLMGAFVLYNRKLTTTERADVSAWLAANPS